MKAADEISIAAVILAAGMSSRMGQPKPLLNFAGQPLIVRIINSFREAAEIDAIVVVTGHEPDAIEQRVTGLAQTLRNVDFATGTCCMLEIVGIAGFISLFQTPARLFAVVGLYSYGLYLTHQPYVIWLGLRIREVPIWAFLLVCIPTLAVLSAWGMLLEKGTNTLMNRLFFARKAAHV